MPETLRATDPLAGDWILLVLLAALGMLGWINLVSPKKWRLLVRSFLSFRLGRQALRDELDLQDRTLIGMVVMASAAVALFAYQYTVLVAHHSTGMGWWLELFLASLVLVVVRVLVLRSAGRLFQADAGLSEYLYTVLLLHVMIAWPHDVTTRPLLPEGMIWRSWGLRVGLVVMGLVTVFRWVRAAVLGLVEGVPLRYVFIYLCALEILPVALAWQQALRYVPDPSHPL
jgi:hypothetical protein